MDPTAELIVQRFALNAARPLRELALAVLGSRDTESIDALARCIDGGFIHARPAYEEES